MSDNVKPFKERALSLVIGGEAFIIPVSCVRRIANGTMTIAEMEDPEATAQAIAVIAMESIKDNL